MFEGRGVGEECSVVGIRWPPLQSTEGLGAGVANSFASFEVGVRVRCDRFWMIAARSKEADYGLFGARKA